MPGVLVLITGSGRSGTSTMAGCLHHLGVAVPGPHLKANSSNPKGFFESAWSVAFHNELFARAGIGLVDSRPEAHALVQAAIEDADHAAVADFLTSITSDTDLVVVKDPRTVWTQALWRAAAEDVGLSTCFLSMLRHPAEVVGSRATYYGPDGQDEAKRRRYESSNLARWINLNLVSERETRGQPRALVRYADLLADWRRVARDLRDQLGLTYQNDLELRPHPADEFVEPGLRRHEQTWDDLLAPEGMIHLARSTWASLERLATPAADGPGPDQRHRPEQAAALDRLTEAYAAVYRDAADVVDDALAAAAAGGRSEGQRAATERKARPAEPTSGELPIHRRRVEQVRSTDLVKVVATRARRRLSPGR